MMSATATTLDYAVPSTGADAGGSQSPKMLESRHTDAVTSSYSASELDKHFTVHFARLQALTNDRRLWVDGVEPPSTSALLWARKALQQFWREEIIPSRVVASAEGGVAICFVNGNKYGDIECLNAGQILGVVTDRRERPTAWEVDQSVRGIARASKKLRLFLYPPTPGSHDTRRQAGR